MEPLWSGLTKAIEGTALVALCAAFVWGILSVILSPCHLSSIPLIVGFISEEGSLTRRRAFNLASLFAAGMLLTIGILGVITASMGRLMGDVGPYGNYLVAAVFFVVGLHLLSVITIPLPDTVKVGMKRRGLLAAFVLGLIFGLALGPCTFAYMAPVLALTFRTATTNLAFGIALLAIYGIGHCSVIVAAGTSAEMVQHYLTWSERSYVMSTIKRICGALVLCGGLYLIYVAN